MRRRIGSQGKGGKGIHDQVDPEQLHSRQDRIFVVVGHSGDKCEQDGCDVDRDLKLWNPLDDADT